MQPAQAMVIAMRHAQRHPPLKFAQHIRACCACCPLLGAPPSALLFALLCAVMQAVEKLVLIDSAGWTEPGTSKAPRFVAAAGVWVLRTDPLRQVREGGSASMCAAGAAACAAKHMLRRQQRTWCCAWCCAAHAHYTAQRMVSRCAPRTTLVCARHCAQGHAYWPLHPPLSRWSG